MTRSCVCVFALMLPVAVFAQSTPVVGPGDASAAGPRTLLAVPDGRVFAWAGNREAEVMRQFSNAVAVAAGNEHALVLTDDGRVFAWGENDAGQLGDGTRVARRNPVRVRDLRNVVAIAAGRLHSLALTADGRVWSWGSNQDGQLGQGATNDLLVPTMIASLSEVVSIDAGRSHSVAVTRTGDVFAWGLNNQGQLGDGSLNNRRRPVRIGISDIEDVSAGATHTLARRGDGAVYSWGSNSRGELGTGSRARAMRPVLLGELRAHAVRAGRRFSGAVAHDGTLMMWGANESGQLGDGSGIDRTTPIEGPAIPAISTLALGGRHAVAVTAGGDVWTWGRDRAPVQAMSDVPDWGPPFAPAPDVWPPTIVAEVSPPVAPWFRDPVSITFHCADDSGSVTCPPPVTVTDDGALQVIRGTAVDPSGNEATVTVTVNVDRTPPSITVNDSPHNTETILSRIQLRGQVLDATSGLAGPLLCGGQPVVVEDGSFACGVDLQLGVNNITVEAADVAGHVTSVAVAVTRVPTAGMAIGPTFRRMVVSELAPLSLLNDGGETVLEATWSSSDTSVAVLSDDDPPVVRAVAPGTTTISATKNGLGADATVIVDTASTLPPGTIRWSIAPTPGLTIQPPIFTNRVAPGVPDMFLVESGARGSATLRGVSADGELLTKQDAPGVPMLGDSFGGVLAGVLYDANSWNDYRAYVRMGQSDEAPPWRYESEGILQVPAQAPDGTLYAIEALAGVDQHGDPFWDKHVIVIDGRSGGLLYRRPLPRDVETYQATDDTGSICTSTRTESSPDTVGPIVGSDGRGYLLVRGRVKNEMGSCTGEPSLARVIENRVEMLVLSPAGSPDVVSIHSEVCSVSGPGEAGCETPPSLTQVAPDGIGGVLAVWGRGVQANARGAVQTIITRRDDQGVLTETHVGDSATIERVGQDATIYVSSADGYTAVDSRTWQPKWTAPVESPTVIAALPDGGVAVVDSSGGYGTIDGAGTYIAARDVSMPIQSPTNEFGSWVGLSGSGLSSAVGEVEDATRWATSSGGNRQGQSAVRKPSVGIFAKGHPVGPSPLFMHVSLRITPSNPSRWLHDPQFARFFAVYTDENGVVTPAVDVYGNVSITLGAGPYSPDGGDTTAFCLFNSILESNINRPMDQGTLPSLRQRLPLWGPEDLVIQTLLTLDARYADNLKYECVPDDPDEFNSNSYISGLLDAATLTKPWFVRWFPALFPGWTKPVPASSFRP